MSTVKIPYYSVKNGNGFWEPNARMKAQGFSSVPCGRDGPGAWRVATEWNERWQVQRVSAKRQQDDLENHKLGYVYFLVVGERVKIGFSSDPFSRVNGLKTGLPNRPSLITAVAGTQSDERHLHRRFAAYRQAGEWLVAVDPIRREMARCISFGRVLRDGNQQLAPAEGTTKSEHLSA